MKKQLCVCVCGGGCTSECWKVLSQIKKGSQNKCWCEVRFCKVGLAKNFLAYCVCVCVLFRICNIYWGTEPSIRDGTFIGVDIGINSVWWPTRINIIFRSCATWRIHWNMTANMPMSTLSLWRGVSVCLSVCIYICMHMCVYVCIECIYACMYIPVFINICIYICVRACLCMYVCIYVLMDINITYAFPSHMLTFIGACTHTYTYVHEI